MTDKTYPKSAYEARTSNACIAAFAMLDGARDHLDRARTSLMAQEAAQPSLAPGATGARIMALAGILDDLARLRADFVQEVMGDLS